MTKKNDLEKYLSAVRQNLSVSWKKGPLLDSLREELQDAGTNDYDQLVSQFGAPEEVAESLSSPADVRKHNKLQKRTIVILAIVAVVLLVASIYAIRLFMQNSGGYVIETLTIYDEPTSSVSASITTVILYLGGFLL